MDSYTWPSELHDFAHCVFVYWIVHVLQCEKLKELFAIFQAFLSKIKLKVPLQVHQQNLQTQVI